MRTKRNTGGIPAPAITMVAREPKTLLGWKDDFNEWCQSRKENQTIEECIEEHTFKKHDAIKDILLGYDSKSIMSNDLVLEDFTMAWQGKFFFVNVSRRMKQMLSLEKTRGTARSKVQSMSNVKAHRH